MVCFCFPWPRERAGSRFCRYPAWKLVLDSAWPGVLGRDGRRYQARHASHGRIRGLREQGGGDPDLQGWCLIQRGMGITSTTYTDRHGTQDSRDEEITKCEVMDT